VAGLGSLGRQRFIAIAEYNGGLLCREAKALAPSAWCWARGGKPEPIRYRRLSTGPSARSILSCACRAAGSCAAWHRTARGSTSRRFHARKTKAIAARHGLGTANLHLASRHVPAVLADLTKRPKDWLHKAAAAMVKATSADWEEWRAASPKASR